MNFTQPYFIRLITFMTFFFVGVANSAPTKIEDRAEYSTALNSSAAIIMNWYGSLITEHDESRNGIENTKNKAILSDTINFDTPNFDTHNIGDQWSEFRSQYPEVISQIVITGTEISKLNDTDAYQFNIKSNITYKAHNDSTNETKTLAESHYDSFVINKSLLFQANELPIRNITKYENKKTKSLELSQYNRSHYKVREFTYAWLAYMDGIDTLQALMNAESWLKSAPYSLKMGNMKIETSVREALQKKKELLAKGGHLIHSINVIKDETQADTFVIDLLLGWKGTNEAGKPVIARINQKIKIKINADKSWKVISIKEKHLLPIIAPWMGLVC